MPRKARVLVPLDQNNKASPIQQDNYLLSCCRYVELNPVRAAMVGQPEEYRWSSYRERMACSAEDMLDPHVAFDVYKGMQLFNQGRGRPTKDGK